MSFFNSLLISVLLWPFPNEVSDNGVFSDKCDSLQVEHKIESTQNGKFTLTISPKGGTAPYQVFIWSDKGNLLSDTGREREFKNLDRGTYEGVVGDGEKCGKKFKIEIP